ncbi:MAG: hypothetical protein ChlgKO_09230 [Chlamydiales bacterium]
MLEKLSTYLPIHKAQNNWKLIAGVSATLIAAVALIAKRILSKASTEPVEDPIEVVKLSKDQVEYPNNLFTKISCESLVHDMSTHLDTRLEECDTQLLESFTVDDLYNYLTEDQPAALITYSGTTYACVLKNETYRVYLPCLSEKAENRATILDFSTVEDLFDHIIGEDANSEYPNSITAEIHLIKQTFFELKTKPFSFEEVKKVLDNNFILSARFSFSEDVNQEYFDEFSKANPLEHPANRMKLLAEIYEVDYSPVILTPFEIR